MHPFMGYYGGLMVPLPPESERCWADGEVGGQCVRRCVRIGLCAECYEAIFGRQPELEAA